METDPRHGTAGVTVDACADLVRRGDPDRFAAVLAAPKSARAALFVLYAWNLEVARAPWVTSEHLIAEMRLQWWRDVVANAASGAARAHEVAAPLHDLIREKQLPIPVMDSLIAARRADIDPNPFADGPSLDGYLSATGGGLIWLAGCALGAGPEAEAPLRDFGHATGYANYLRAVPELLARGRTPLPEVTPGALRGLAERGMQALIRAAEARHHIPHAVAPALLAGWQTKAILRAALDDPAKVIEGQLELSEFHRRARLLWQASTGRW